MLVLSFGPGVLRATEEVLTGLDWGGLESREVRVHLPPGGVTLATPVLIAFDGHMLAAWHLDKTVADLTARRTIVPPLVVAIPAGRDRLDEYGMAGVLDYAGRGKLAAKFQKVVLESVLPAVRQRYGVPADSAHTGIMGASLGGLAAFDLAWRHPEIFGFAGIFSGSFWWRGENGGPAVQQSARLAHQLVRASHPAPRNSRLWFEAGSLDETDDRDGNGVIDAIQDTTELMDEIARVGPPRGPALRYVEMPGGRHNEETWGQALPQFLQWALPAAKH